MTALKVIQIPQLSDNYSFLLICEQTNQAAIIDCPEAKPMIAQIEALQVEPIAIFNTHHHWDHVDGNEELLARWPKMKVYGHEIDKDRIPGLTNPLQDGDQVTLGQHCAFVLFTPGHTKGHIAYWFEEQKKLFVGDTLFAAGCGRIFEGTHQQMHHSLQKLGALDKDATVYCGHEYTLSNINFALSVDPQNKALQKRQQEVLQKREKNEATVPFTLAEEWKTNPFLRYEQDSIRKVAEKQGADLQEPISIFKAIRTLKDQS